MRLWLISGMFFNSAGGEASRCLAERTMLVLLVMQACRESVLLQPPCTCEQGDGVPSWAEARMQHAAAERPKGLTAKILRPATSSSSSSVVVAAGRIP